MVDLAGRGALLPCRQLFSYSQPRRRHFSQKSESIARAWVERFDASIACVVVLKRYPLRVAMSSPLA